VVQQHAVDLAQTLYNDNRRQVEIGTLAPLEVVRAEAQVATAQQALIAAQTTQLQDQIVLMSLISKDPNAAELRNVEIIPTDTPQPPPPIEEISLEDAINEATQNRPDVLQSKINLEVDDINVKATRNALLPSLTLSGFATSVGLGGNNRITTTAPGAGTLILAPGNNPVQVINDLTLLPTTLILPNVTTTTVGINQGGFSDAFSMLFHNRFPEYQAQISLAIPIGNRVAQADSTRAILSQRQDQSRYQQVLNNVTVDVHNAQVVFQQARGAVVAAQKARQLQEQTLDADQRRLQLGASTIFVVVTDQQNLAIAAAAEVRAQVNLAEARVGFERALGRTLTANRISIADAKSRTVSRESLIPGTRATGELTGLKEAFARLPN
jgi:outer membrane protein